MHDDFYQMYLDELKEVIPCSAEEVVRLTASAAQGGKEAKERLIEGNLTRALERAREAAGRGVMLTDLVQEANMALVVAVNEYVQLPEAGRPDFIPFITQKMDEAIERAIGEQNASDRTGEELAACVNVLLEVSRVMAEELDREATVEELAAKMKMSRDEVEEIMKLAMDAMRTNGEYLDPGALSGLSDTSFGGEKA